MGRDSGIEIKVTNPKKGDNAIHPEGEKSSPKDDRRRHQGPELGQFEKWVPWLMPSFLVVNVVLFVVTMYVNDCPQNSGKCLGEFLGRFSFQPMKENPLLGPSTAALQDMGALNLTKVVEEHQTWRLFTCMWLHAGVFHLLANMLSLAFIGIRLEQEFGFVKIGLLYVLSGYGGVLVSSLFIPVNISVGASGALFGLLGSMLSELLTNWTLYANKLVSLLILTVIIMFNLAVGLLPHVDNFAHIGGFLSGFFLGFLFLIRPQFGYISKKKIPEGYQGRQKQKHQTYQYVLWIMSLILLLSGFIAGTILLLRGANMNDYCPWCHYMSCIPTSFWDCKKERIPYCQTIELGNQLNLTCISNGKTSTYTLPVHDQVKLCTQLCN